MHRETVTPKISFLINLDKTSMTPLQTYTIQTSRSVNITDLLLPPNNHFSLVRLTSALIVADP